MYYDKRYILFFFPLELNRTILLTPHILHHMNSCYMKSLSHQINKCSLRQRYQLPQTEKAKMATVGVIKDSVKGKEK